MRPPSSLKSYSPGKEDISAYRQRYLESIPYEFQHLVCMDSSAEIKAWQREQPDGIYTPTVFFQNGIVTCAKCNKYTALWSYLEICFSCEEMYVVSTCPDKMMLCPGCGG